MHGTFLDPPRHSHSHNTKYHQNSWVILLDPWLTPFEKFCGNYFCKILMLQENWHQIRKCNIFGEGNKYYKLGLEKSAANLWRNLSTYYCVVYMFDIWCLMLLVSHVLFMITKINHSLQKTRNIILFTGNAIDMLLGWLKEYETYKNSLPFVLKGFLLGHMSCSFSGSLPYFYSTLSNFCILCSVLVW